MKEPSLASSLILGSLKSDVSNEICLSVSVLGKTYPQSSEEKALDCLFKSHGMDGGWLLREAFFKEQVFVALVSGSINGG